MTVAIQDVAREANLSISTISKYLNGGAVRPGNRAKIEAAIEKLGYHPNTFARCLRGGSTHTIGLLLFNLRDACSADMVAAIEQLLRDAGFSMVLVTHQGSLDLARDAVDFLLAEQVDGLLVMPVPGMEPALQIFRASGKPIVSIDSTLDAGLFDSVTTNSMIGMYQATEYLICKGHRDIGIITGGLPETKTLSTSRDRVNGFLRAMEDYQLPVCPQWMAAGDFRFQSGYRAMNAIWQCARRPTALLVSNYHMFLGAMRAIHEQKIQIPRDLSLVTMDNMALTWISCPGITCIEQPTLQLAEAAVKLIIRRLRGDTADFPKAVKLYTTFVERDSVCELHHSAET